MLLTKHEGQRSVGEVDVRKRRDRVITEGNKGKEGVVLV
jgi:hypothetical protein